jgi:hypothetical protein
VPKVSLSGKVLAIGRIKPTGWPDALIGAFDQCRPLDANDATLPCECRERERERERERDG